MKDETTPISIYHMIHTFVFPIKINQHPNTCKKKLYNSMIRRKIPSFRVHACLVD